jgi:hypothetical protein
VPEEEDPADPHLVQIAWTDLAGITTDIEVSSNYTFVANSELGVQILDTSILLIPYQVSGYPAGTVYDIDVEGNYVYAAEVDSGLIILDVTDPTRPRKTGVLPIIGHAYGVEVRKGRAYVIGDSGLVACDVNQPSAPTVLSRCALPVGRRVALSGGFAYTACFDQGIASIDVKNGVDLRLCDMVWTYDAYDIAIAGSYAYVADGRNGVKIVDLRNPQEMTVVGSIHAWRGDRVNDVAISGSYLFVLNSPDGIYVYDTREPAVPKWITCYKKTRGQRAMHAVDNFLYVAAGSGGVEILQRRDF